jgi:hypothetical protein
VDAGDTDVEMPRGRHTHRSENRHGFERDRNVSRPRGQDRNRWNAALIPRIPNGHPRLGINRRESGQQPHLIVTQPGCNTKLFFILEQLTQVFARFARSEHDFGNSGSCFTVPVPANVRHDARTGSERLPL